MLGLLKKYRYFAQEQLNIIENAAQNNDDSLLKYHAHLLAGMASSMGFLEVSKLAGKLEGIAMNCNNGELTECLADLQKSYRATLASIDDKYSD